MIIKTVFGEGGGGMYPTGEVVAFVANIIDCGLQENKFNDGKLQPKVMFVFELNCNNDEGKHMSISKTFTASMHKKGNLRPFIEQWRGKPYADDEVAVFDTDKLLHKYVVLNLQKKKNEKNGKEYTEIFSIRNAQAADYFTDIQLDGYVPEYAQELIKNQKKLESVESKPSAPVQVQFGGSSSFPDDIPF